VILRRGHRSAPSLHPESGDAESAADQARKCCARVGPVRRFSGSQ